MTQPVGAGGPPSYQSLLAQDSRAVPDCLRDSAPPQDLGLQPVPADRYTSRAFFDREVERMWSRVWQMACREEEIAEVGDVHVYDIVDKSVLVVRSEPGRIRAFVNSCLHRGRKLRTEGGSVRNLRCGFHGWTWNLDGTLSSLPCRWDFPQVTQEETRLPEIRVGTWGGFVFVNFDPDAPPLAEYLGILPQHFARWRLEDCWKSVHVARVIPCNWKVAQEAFMESYHVIATHPQILPIYADATSQYDLYGDHVNRNLGAFGAPSPHLMSSPPSGDDVVAGMLDLWGRPGAAAPPAPDLIAARRVLGDIGRRSFQKAFGGDYSEISDAEILDALVYNVFPNFAPWGGFAPNIVYRWRPNGRDPDSCIMEVMILKRLPDGAQRPKPVPVHWLRPDEPWSAATELPVLGPVIDQDMENMPFVQQGLHASATGRVHLADYEESRIRHFHATLEKYVGTG